MKSMNLILIGAMLLCSIFSCEKNPVEPPIDDPQVQWLTDSLQYLYDNSLLPGFAVTMVKNDKIAYQNSFGFANIANGVKYTNQTTQPIASISKTFIAAALMKAIELGHFTLETKINDVLPFQVINPNSPNVDIQIKHLVTHTSGLVDEEETYNIGSYFYFPGEFEKLTLGMQGILTEVGIQEGSSMPLAKYMKAYYTPEGALYSVENFGEAAGLEYEYSNIAASLTAYLIEVKSEMLYRDFVKQFVLDPLGMSHSAFRYNDLDESRSATLYLSKNDFYPKYSSHSYPDGFLNSSNEDMGKFLLEMIRGKKGKGSLLSQDSYQLLFSKNELPDEDFEHGVFWDITSDRIEHTGGDPGVTTILSFDPVMETGLYIMVNIDTNSDDAETIFSQLEKILTLSKEFEKQ